MSLLFSLPAALLVGVIMPFVSAVPDVTPVRVGTGCSAYPNWYPSPESDTTGGFRFVVDQADDDTINGFYSTTKTFTGADGQPTKTMIITANDGAKPVFACNSGVVEDYYYSAPPAVTTIYFSGTTGDDELTYLASGGAVETYAHQIQGVQQDGVFIGASNATTWAFKYQPAAGAGNPEYYQLRLLLPDAADQLQDGEFAGFIKVVSA